MGKKISELDEIFDLQDGDLLEVVRGSGNFRIKKENMGAGGAVIVPEIKPTTEILATSKKQTIPIYGFDLNKITSLTLTDANVIDINTDLLIVNSGYAELTVTMNSTVGFKDLTVNGTIVYSQWIKADVTAGWHFWGSDYNAAPSQGYTNSDSVQVKDLNNQVVQFPDGIALSQAAGIRFNFVKLNDFSANSTQVIETILKMGSFSAVFNDTLYIGAIDRNFLPVANSWGIDFANHAVFTSVLNAAHVSSFNNGTSHSLVTLLPFIMPVRVSYGGGEYYKIIDSAKKMEFYILNDLNDLRGNLITTIYKTGGTNWSAGIDYVPYINMYNNTRTSVSIVASRKR